jgi:hypothetical protein
MLKLLRVVGLGVLSTLWVQVGTAADYLWSADAPGEPPQWIRQLPPSSATLGETRFEISLPANNQLALAVTLFYREQEGGFLRVLWGQEGQETALTMNLYEGIGMENRRTLLLDLPRAASSSQLTLQSFDPSTAISKAYFQWIEPTTVYQPSRENPIVLIDEYGENFLKEEAAGWPEPLPQDAWIDGVTIAPLIQRPERIEDGVAFIFELVELPELARIEVELSGLPPEWPCELWVNGLPAALLNVEVPSLTDPGYRKDAASELWMWTGWRKGSALIPVELLQAGENEVILDVSTSNLVHQLPVAVKNLNLELLYEDQAETFIRPVDVPPLWEKASTEATTVVPGSPVQLEFITPQLELME